MDRHLKVGEVAKHLHVSIRTVCKWFDKGMLKGYRIPGSDHRRFDPKDVVEFAKSNQLPVPSSLEACSAEI